MRNGYLLDAIIIMMVVRKERARLHLHRFCKATEDGDRRTTGPAFDPAQVPHGQAGLSGKVLLGQLARQPETPHVAPDDPIPIHA
ncbi:MAG: hypothetical protein ACI9LT_002146 [Pseudoalteromonas distincta]|jgi:hypothetical protein